MPGAEAAFGQFDHYEPFVVVDLADLADDQSDLYGTVDGETSDVNNELFACGWYEDTSGYDIPFYLNPLDGGAAAKLDMTDPGETTYQSGRALAINEPGSYDVSEVVIVGWVAESASEPRAAYWDNNGSNWALHIIDDQIDGEDPMALDINDDAELIVGWWYDSANSKTRPFNYDVDSDSTNPWSMIEGEITGIHTDGAVDALAGTRMDAPGSPSPAAFHAILGGAVNYLEAEDNPTDYEETYGMAVNGYDDIVGYAIDTDVMPADVHGVLWFYDDPGWTDVVLDQDNPDPVDSSLMDVTDQTDGTVDIVGTYWDSGLPDGAFYVTVDPQGNYYSHSLDEVGGGGFAHSSFALFPLRIRREVEDNSWTPETYSANGVNNVATIAGSYDDGNPSGSSIRPCLYVANDFDNNGQPDFREILQARLASDPELDHNSNWIIDWAENDQDEGEDSAENLRVGLHAPGIDGTTGANGSKMLLVDDVQIVRLPVKYQSLNNPASFPDDFGLDDIADADPDCTMCGDLYDHIVEWGTSDGDGGDHAREIIVTLRNQYSGDDHYDEIPTGSGYDSRIDTLKNYAYRFAKCTDYMQFGNEAFTSDGPSSFYVDVGSGDEHISSLTGQDYKDGVELILDWVEEQADVARRASALAGRPLRFIGPGFPGGNIRTGYDYSGGYGVLDDDESRASYFILETSKYVNKNRMFFDVHLHYTSVSWATATSGSPPGVIPAIVDDSSSSWAGHAPKAVVSLEWGPKADGTWIDPDIIEQFDLYFDENGDDPDDDWDTFVDDWESTQFSGAGFDLPGILESMFDNGFAAACFAPSIQPHSESNLAILFDCAVLRGQHVRDAWIDDSDKFTDMLFDRYQHADAAPEYDISSFDPHCSTCNDCDEEIVCPGCGS